MFSTFIRSLAIAAVMVPGAVLVAPAPSDAGVFISVSFGPPALPVYTQPFCPGPGYLWTPGYWSYAGGGYYWVPGAWVRPPAYGLLWTPPYWGYAGNGYGFHPGYWGHQVGFYGGINYGYGYGGVGYGGGYWRRNEFVYNRTVNNVNVNVIHNTYVRNVTVVNDYGRTSYNGGPHGVPIRPTASELAFERTQHIGATSFQTHQFEAARTDRYAYARYNGGRPATPALASDRSGFGYRNEVNTRQGNQQSRIAHGVQGGGITPGEERNLEARDNSIHTQARYDRAANGGYLSGAERRNINARQNNVSRSIYTDRHNANNDAAAAYRHGTTRGQEHFQAHQIHQETRPRGPEDHPRR